MPDPTMLDVESAIKKVQAKWGADIPKALKSYKANQFVILANDLQFTLAFKWAYETVFKPANKMLEITRKAQGGVPGFVTPVADQKNRKIYISPGIAKFASSVQRMIMSHEYIHWLSHEDFYPKYYKQAGLCPFQVEGVTQSMTVRCGYTSEFAAVPAYRDETLKTDAWLSADNANEQRMLDYIFGGKKTDLSAIHP